MSTVPSPYRRAVGALVALAAAVGLGVAAPQASAASSIYVCADNRQGNTVRSTCTSYLGKVRLRVHCKNDNVKVSGWVYAGQTRNLGPIHCKTGIYRISHQTG